HGAEQVGHVPYLVDQDLVEQGFDAGPHGRVPAEDAVAALRELEERDRPHELTGSEEQKGEAFRQVRHDLDRGLDGSGRVPQLELEAEGRHDLAEDARVIGLLEIGEVAWLQTAAAPETLEPTPVEQVVDTPALALVGPRDGDQPLYQRRGLANGSVAPMPGGE